MDLRNWLKTRPGLNTALGIVFAILAGLLLTGYVSNVLKGRRGGPLVTVPVAGKSISIGTTIGRELLTFRQIPREYLVPGTITNPEDVVGKRSLRSIEKGEPFTNSCVPGKGGPDILASRIPASLRAFTLTLGRISGTGNDLHPGDTVDVLATSGEPPVTNTILRGKTIVDAGGSIRASGSEDDSTSGIQITLLVSPREAELLAQAQCGCEISIVLCPAAGSSGDTGR